MKILVGILAHQLHSETLRRVHSQDWADPDGYDVLTLWGGDKQPDESRFAAVTRKYQKLQRTFLAGPWDCLLCVEQDMLIPLDAISRLAPLIADGADIAYALYVWRYQEQHWWSAHPKIEQGGDRELLFWSLTHMPEEAKRHWGDVVRIAGLGLGCTMISRHTLTRLSFRQGRPDHCCDATLALDAQSEGLISVADLGAVCGHRIDDTRVVWPDPTTDTLYRIEGDLYGNHQVPRPADGDHVRTND